MEKSDAQLKAIKSKGLKTGMLSRGIAKRNEQGIKSGWGAQTETKLFDGRTRDSKKLNANHKDYMR